MPISDQAEMPLIDRDQFDMLVATGEEEAAAMLAELLDLFVSEAEPKLKELAQVASLGDRYRCNRIAHAIAGASANLGGMRLAAVCRAYENSVEQQSIDELKRGAARIQATYNITVDEMRAEIAKL